MSRALRALATLALLIGAPGTARAQEPVRPTVPDSLPADTLAGDSAAARPDTAPPPPRFSAIMGEAPRGVAGTQFLWTRDALLREGHATLADLLEQIPGMTVLRSGLFIQPLGVSALGGTRGRLEVVLDGYVLDPLTTATLDIGELEVVQIDELRVERRLDVTRIHISTVEARTGQPYSRIEAATGEPEGTNIFRAVFTAPYVIAGPISAALDRLDTDAGAARRSDPRLREVSEDADLFGLWAKWSAFGAGGARGVQLELRQTRLRRLTSVPWTVDQTRRDLVLRGRTRIMEGIGAELFAGRSSISLAPSDSTQGDSIATLERAGWQYGARAALRRGPGWVDAELRFRTADGLPSRQLDVSGGLDVAGVVRVAGSATSAGWSEGESANAFDVRAEAGLFRGIGVFAELAGGKRGAPLYDDSLGHNPTETHTVGDRAGQRVGAFARFGAVDATAAIVQLEADSARSFGLQFDDFAPGSLVADAKGFEVFGRLPLWPRALSVTGAYNYWSESPGWVYLPTRSWRVAAELHTLPLPSGNLEILGRIEHQRRGPMLVPDPAFDPDDETSSRFQSLPTRNLLNAYLQIRIIDVRAFIQYNDMLGDFREDVFGRVLRGPRFWYGVKWQLFN